MKIFTAFLQGKPGHPIPAYNFWQYYIKNGLEEARHSWIEHPEIDWAAGLLNQPAYKLEEWKTNTWEKVVEYLEKHPCELFLSYLYPHQIDRTAIKHIQQSGIPCVNFYCDHVRHFTKVPDEFSVFDLNWVSEYKALKWYKEADYPHLHLPMPMWVSPEYRTPGTETFPFSSFIGSYDFQRHLFFEKLVRSLPETDIRLFGHGWDGSTPYPPSITKEGTNILCKVLNQFYFLRRFGLTAYYRKMNQRKLKFPIAESLRNTFQGPVDSQDYMKITRGSKITFGISRYPSFRHPLNKPDTYSRLRDIESPMLGACYVTEYTEGLEELFDLGKEILTYQTIDELLMIIEMLKNNKQLRTDLRKKGQIRALGEHTVKSSIQKISKYLHLG